MSLGEFGGAKWCCRFAGSMFRRTKVALRLWSGDGPLRIGEMGGMVKIGIGGDTWRRCGRFGKSREAI